MTLESAFPSKGKRKRKLLEDISPDSDVTRDNSLVRALGSVDWHTRETALFGISTLLFEKSDITADELLKIWKGIYVAFWHSDKPDVQVCGALCS